MSLPVVNAYNEWDPLEEVIVGRADGACEPSYNVDPVWRYLFHSTEISLSKAGPYPRDLIECGKRELDNLTRVLETQCNVKVRRPEIMDFEKGYEGPAYKVPNGFNCTCPRDVLMVMGNEIMEAPMGLRSRQYEYTCYRPLIQEYFKQGADWTAAPKGVMSDALYCKDFPPDANSPERKEAIYGHKYITSEEEPIWDAADFMRFGKDVFGQRSFVTNEFGIEWVRRHLKPKGFRVHTMFSEDLVPKHIDCTLVPLRPGLVFENPTRKMSTRSVFKDNGWEIVQSVAPNGNTKDEFSDSVIRPTSTWIGMNFFSVSPDTIIASEMEKGINEQLRSLGFKVLEVPFKAMFYLGGAFHCATTDVRRRGGMQSYFPKFDEMEAKMAEDGKYTNFLGSYEDPTYGNGPAAE